MTQSSVEAAQASSYAQDREARHLAQTEFVTPLVIEAGAGTGKTSTLVARIVVWLLGTGWERAARYYHEKGDAVAPHRIAQRALQGTVAITFTEKAAAEMAKRVAEMLLELNHAEPDVEELQGLDLALLPIDTNERIARARELLSLIDQLPVSTIHAFCHRLLSEFPLEAGLHPEFELDDGTRSGVGALREIVGAVLEKQIRDEAQRAGGPLSKLCTVKIDFATLADAVVALHEDGLGYADLAQDPLRPEAFRRLRDRVLEFFEAWAKNQGPLLQNLAAQQATAIFEALECSIELFRGWQDFSVAEFCQIQQRCGEFWAKTASNGLKRWSTSDWNKGEQAELSTHDAELLSQNATLAQTLLKHIQAIDPPGLRVVHDALALLLRATQEAARASGVESFSDLLRDARDLLRDHPHIAGLVRGRIDQLLVDEFQDTDATQCDLVETLALQGDPVARPGLFLVGDPKQSIYGWRNADLRAYDAFLAKVGGTRHLLTVNYRSLPPILDEVERVIAPIMQEEIGLQPRFERLLCCAKKAASQANFAEPRATVEYWVTQKYGEGGKDKKGKYAKPRFLAEQKAQFEAQAIARDLRDLHQKENVAWSSVGILFRSGGDAETYLRELRNAGIPYVVEGDKQYYLRREVIEATALVCSILDPNDHLSLLAWLRSAWVGVPDAALPLLWARFFPGAVSRLHGKVSDELLALVAAVGVELQHKPELVAFAGLQRIAGWEESLKAALHCLGALRQSLAEDCAEDFIEKIRHLTLIEPIEAARFLGAFRLANLERFFEGLRTLFESTHGNVGEILHILRDPVRAQREAEDARPRAGLEDAVQVMTIHKAKGLDFEHVYVVQMHKGKNGGDGDKPSVEWFEHGVEYAALGQRTLGMDEAMLQQQKTEACERVRTLYVAMTRAKQRLVLLGDWPVESKPVFKATSFADLLPQRRDGWIDAQQRMLHLVDASTSDAELPWFCDEKNTRWVFPALRRADGVAGLTSASVPSGVEEDLQNEAAAQRVRALRAQAALCQARPFALAASRVAKLVEADAASAFAAGEELEEVNPFAAAALIRSTQKCDDAKAAPQASAKTTDSEIARAVGTALHRVLEEIDLAGDPSAALNLQRARLVSDLEVLPSAEQRTLALAKANALLDSLAANGLLQRLFALRDSIVARELSLLLPPTLAELGEATPVGFVSGTLDLLYCESLNRELTPAPRGAQLAATQAVSFAPAPRWVVVDYKTDLVTTPEEIDERARSYALQGELYCRAVQQALGLAEKPRFELWFVAAGVVRSVA